MSNYFCLKFWTECEKYLINFLYFKYSLINCEHYVCNPVNYIWNNIASYFFCLFILIKINFWQKKKDYFINLSKGMYILAWFHVTNHLERGMPDSRRYHSQFCLISEDRGFCVFIFKMVFSSLKYLRVYVSVQLT